MMNTLLQIRRKSRNSCRFNEIIFSNLSRSMCVSEQKIRMVKGIVKKSESRTKSEEDEFKEKQKPDLPNLSENIAVKATKIGALANAGSSTY